MKEQDRIDNAIALAAKAAADASGGRKRAHIKRAPRKMTLIVSAKPPLPPVKSAAKRIAPRVPVPIIGQRTTDVPPMPAPRRRRVPAPITPASLNKAKPRITSHQRQHILSFAAGATLGVASVAAGAYAGLAALGFAAVATAAIGRIPRPASCALGLVSGCVGAFTLAVVNLASHHAHQVAYSEHPTQPRAERALVLAQSAVPTTPKFMNRIRP